MKKVWTWYCEMVDRIPDQVADTVLKVLWGMVISIMFVSLGLSIVGSYRQASIEAGVCPSLRVSDCKAYGHQWRNAPVVERIKDHE